MEKIDQLIAIRDNAYRAMIAADDKWFDAIIARYGESYASTYRYTSKGVEGKALAGLHQSYRDARDVYIAAQDAYIKARDWGLYA